MIGIIHSGSNPSVSRSSIRLWSVFGQMQSQRRDSRSRSRHRSRGHRRHESKEYRDRRRPLSRTQDLSRARSPDLPDSWHNPHEPIMTQRRNMDWLFHDMLSRPIFHERTIQLAFLFLMLSLSTLCPTVLKIGLCALLSMVGMSHVRCFEIALKRHFLPCFFVNSTDKKTMLILRSSSSICLQKSPLKLAPWGQTPPFLDTEWGALKKAYKMDGHKEFAWIQNGRAQSEP